MKGNYLQTALCLHHSTNLQLFCDTDHRPTFAYLSPSSAKTPKTLSLSKKHLNLQGSSRRQTNANGIFKIKTVANKLILTNNTKTRNRNEDTPPCDCKTMCQQRVQTNPIPKLIYLIMLFKYDVL